MKLQFPIAILLTLLPAVALAQRDLKNIPSADPDATGVQIWVDGKPHAFTAASAGKFNLDLKTGPHTITLAVDRDVRQTLKLSLPEGATTTAKVQLVGGK